MASSSRIERVLRAVAIALFACVLAGGTAHAQPALDPAAAAVLDRWLRSSCLGDEAAGLEAELRRHAAALAPALRRALAAGPPAADIAAVREAATQRHAQRAAFDWQGMEVTGVDRAALARVQREPARAFVDDQVRRFVNGWKSNAIAGLGVIGEPADRATLRRMAARAGDPLAPAARAALQRLQTQ